ncbi:unnamed protein product, partial [Rotaria sp. Silwood1]
MDARTVASSYAQLLHLLCQLSQEAIEAPIIADLGSFTLTTQATSLYYVQMIIKDRIDIIIRNANGLGTNAVATIPSNVTNIALISTTVYEMMDGSLCYCLAGKTCSMPAAIYWDVVEQMGNVYSINRNKTLVRGMQTDCFVSNGLFSSTLECYYDSSCLELLVSNTTAFTPLNATIPSKFSIDSRVQDLMNELMLEEIDSSYSLEMYYPHCAPLTCMYSYTHRVELLTIITSIIGLVG